jgi:hypothetical protein
MCYPSAMSKFFAPNLERAGRIVRAVGGLALLAGGVVALFYIWWLGLILLASAAFVLFEAARGWCFFRACGIKTRL